MDLKHAEQADKDLALRPGPSAGGWPVNKAHGFLQVQLGVVSILRSINGPKLLPCKQKAADFSLGMFKAGLRMCGSDAEPGNLSDPSLKYIGCKIYLELNEVP